MILGSKLLVGQPEPEVSLRRVGASCPGEAGEAGEAEVPAMSEAKEHCVQSLADKKMWETSVQVMQGCAVFQMPFVFSKKGTVGIASKPIGVFSAAAFAGKIKQSHPAFEPSNTEWAISAPA